MKILVLEDRGSVTHYLGRALEEKGHQSLLAHTIRDARSYWEDCKIDCLIVDLNMDPRGLTESEIAQTQGGLLSGWIWLKNYVLAKRPEMRSKSIIYTDYTDQLEAYVPADERLGITIIGKRGKASDSGADRVLARVSEIACLPCRGESDVQ